MIVGIDIGSTTVKAVASDTGHTVWQDYRRHNARQAEVTLDMLQRMEAEIGLTAGRDVVALTGSGAGRIAELLGGRLIQEVVAVAAAVEALHPDVRFVSEIGGEDMKTIFFTETAVGLAKQVYMQSACSGGTGTFIEKSARKLNVSHERLVDMAYADKVLHHISAKCGIFAETDANTLVKAGVPEDEIIASLFEAVVRQNLATLAKGNTPMPKVLLLGGPNMFFRGLQEAWTAHLARLWDERGVCLPDGRAAKDLVEVPPDALLYACMGCVEIARREPDSARRYGGTEKLEWWIREGQTASKAGEGAQALATGGSDLGWFLDRYGGPRPVVRGPRRSRGLALGCDFGSTTSKAVAVDDRGAIQSAFYANSLGNPVEDAKALFRQLRADGVSDVSAVGVTGYGKDLLKGIIGADVPIVETVAHATAALRFFPDADVICDVGGTDVKILVLRQGAVVDFRLNSQCSSGNGSFLQGVAERYDIRLDQYADHAFAAEKMPKLSMGCGVFLQSDIVNQQRKGWSPDEIMAGLASVLPLNVWVYAGQFQNLRALGRKFVLQGGTHRNLAVVKAQVDFIRAKVPDAEIVVHPHAGEAGALGAALLAAEHATTGAPTAFRGYDDIERLVYHSSTNAATSCNWCTMNCRRSFIDVERRRAPGKPYSKLPLAPGWDRIITGNSCARGLIEDPEEMKARKKELDGAKDVFPNMAEIVRDTAFR